MGWCWRRCLSEEDEDEDDIGYYPLCWGVFFVVILFWGGLFFSLVAVGMMVVIMMMNGKHICPHEMVFFSFSSYIYLVQRTDFFFPFSPTQEVIRVKIATLCWLCCCCCR